MTRENAKTLLPVITAYAEGRDVEYFSTCRNQWEHIFHADFSDVPERYRIKPQPREIFRIELTDGTLAIAEFKSFTEAQVQGQNWADFRRVVKLVEVPI